MGRLLRLVGLAALGYLVARVTGLTVHTGSPIYRYGTALLLGIGLYASTYGIELGELRRNRRLVLSAVTVGVLVKAVLIGGSLALAFRDPVFLVLGVAVAQIDPLSVAALLGDERMSPRAKAILAAWASFDDPITVILAIYAGISLPHGSITLAAGLRGYAVDLALNLAFAAVAYLVWRLTRGQQVLALVGLVVLFAVAVSQFLMLGLAIAGLFYRPRLDRVVGYLTQGALAVALLLLGVLLVGGVSPGRGVALGAAAYAAQMVVGWLLTRHLPTIDRLHLAFAQQNGITAIILALRLETDYPGAVAVIAPAILVTNTIFLVANSLVDRQLGRTA
jgi:NhaP-type Na+/H+ or K+/H+ antiporter